jgi:hypothetical protein
VRGLRLRASLRRKQGGAAVMETAFPSAWWIGLCSISAGSSRSTRWSRSCWNGRSRPAPAPQRFTFVRPRDGWIFVSVSGGAEPPAVGVTATLDGDALPLWPHGGGREALRLVARGAHQLDVSGARPGMRLRVNAIPEIFN